MINNRIKRQGNQQFKQRARKQKIKRGTNRQINQRKLNRKEEMIKLLNSKVDGQGVQHECIESQQRDIVNLKEQIKKIKGESNSKDRALKNLRDKIEELEYNQTYRDGQMQLQQQEELERNAEFEKIKRLLLVVKRVFSENLKEIQKGQNQVLKTTQKKKAQQVVERYQDSMKILNMDEKEINQFITPQASQNILIKNEGDLEQQLFGSEEYNKLIENSRALDNIEALDLDDININQIYEILDQVIDQRIQQEKQNVNRKSQKQIKLQQQNQKQKKQKEIVSE
ncbi:hypothetical protein PPERSA_02197 [Pseudocohnilembus persalinus]|uniref:Uncharacterized protein n=1 Tax=Pseudocohnilembus persalinus TaxID=266149 RepID=A0A0V0R0S2_PSEPJ|nr:hypothetical protein PPERSA_02197 [Pseudocohnilembus persalinus]|eukprot:KRX08065.1 hypothetical protein PPERSA_02197 [Pseudocohnilembus persalinus]